MKLYFSIDLESWAYPDTPKFLRLSSSERKKIDDGFVFESVNGILGLLAKYDRKITFFCLGELFEWYPELFRKIRGQGHELAYHTHSHRIINDNNVLEEELLRSKEFLEEFKPVGFRAPEIYLNKDAVKILAQRGFRYSSSAYASFNDTIAHGQADFHEFPVSTYKCRPQGRKRQLEYPRRLGRAILSGEIPFGSGYLLAVLPLRIITGFIDSYLENNKAAFIFAHNWQIIPPRQAAFPDIKYKLTHPFYLPYTISIKKKICALLERYQTGRMDELICSQKNTGIKK